MAKPLAIALLLTVLMVALGFGARSCLFCAGNFATRELMGSGYRDYDIEGEILGEDGTSLNFASISIDASKTIKAGTDSKSDSEHLRLSGHKFHIRRKNYSHVSLHISRNGYEPQYHSFEGGGQFKNVKINLKRAASTGPTTGPMYYQIHRAQ